MDDDGIIEVIFEDFFGSDNKNRWIVFFIVCGDFLVFDFDVFYKFVVGYVFLFFV